MENDLGDRLTYQYINGQLKYKNHVQIVGTYTAGTGLFTASENGWEIYWSLFKFPTNYTGKK